MNQTNFSEDLKSEVLSYVESNPPSKITRILFIAKAFASIILFCLCYVLALNSENPLPLYALLGVCASLIGFNWFHDASHGTLFPSAQANKTAVKISDFLTCISSYCWHWQHVIQHHSHVNDEGDPDIHQMPYIRLSPTDKKRWYHRGQAFYAIILYGASYISWSWFSDLRAYTKRQVHLKKTKMDFWDKVIFWSGKVTCFILFFVVPSFFLPLKTVLLGYLVFGVTCGILTSLIFQLAHAVTGSEFVKIRNPELYKNDPQVNQMLESTDFASGSVVLNSLIGGLNHQSIHHLFPRLSHFWYPKLVPIVKRVADKHGLPYKSMSVGKIIISHFKFLHQMGNEQ